MADLFMSCKNITSNYNMIHLDVLECNNLGLDQFDFYGLKCFLSVSTIRAPDLDI